jgi:lysozyme
VRLLFAWVLCVAVLAGDLCGQELPPERLPSQSLIEDFGSSFGAAPDRTARPLLPIALALLKEFEGWSATAYDDAAGYCTIGYGHLIALQPCQKSDLGSFTNGLSKIDGEALLVKDTITARLAIQELVSVELSNEQFGALTSFVFNIGKSKFARSTVLRLINGREFDGAAGQMARWVRAADRILPGLVERRLCEIALFHGYLQYTSQSRVDRSSCKSLGIASDMMTSIDIMRGE